MKHALGVTGLIESSAGVEMSSVLMVGVSLVLSACCSAVSQAASIAHAAIVKAQNATPDIIRSNFIFLWLRRVTNID
jgi:hypothetical protein